MGRLSPPPISAHDLEAEEIPGLRRTTPYHPTEPQHACQAVSGVYFHSSLRDSRNWTYRVNRCSSGIRVHSTLTLGMKRGKSGGVIPERYHPRKSKVITTKYWTADRNRLKLTAYRGSLGAARGADVPSNPIHASTKRNP